MLVSLGQVVRVTTGSVAYAAAVVVAELADRRQVRPSRRVLSSLATWPLVVIGFVAERSVGGVAVCWVSRLLGMMED